MNIQTTYWDETLTLVKTEGFDDQVWDTQKIFQEKITQTLGESDQLFLHILLNQTKSSLSEYEKLEKVLAGTDTTNTEIFKSIVRNELSSLRKSLLSMWLFSDEMTLEDLEYFVKNYNWVFEK